MKYAPGGYLIMRLCATSIRVTAARSIGKCRVSESFSIARFVSPRPISCTLSPRNHLHKLPLPTLAAASSIETVKHPNLPITTCNPFWCSKWRLADFVGAGDAVKGGGDDAAGVTGAFTGRVEAGNVNVLKRFRVTRETHR